MLTRAAFVRPPALPPSPRPRPSRPVQVPRLALDLETFIGRPVSEGEAAASCLELDHCGACLVL